MEVEPILRSEGEPNLNSKSVPQAAISPTRNVVPGTFGAMSFERGDWPLFVKRLKNPAVFLDSRICQ